MFQVASHPSSFAIHGHGHHHHHHPSTYAIHSAGVQLPRTLARPSFAEVSRDAIVNAAPELVSVPPEYIRRGLRPKAHQMLSGIAALSSSHLPSTLPRSHVPASLTVPVRNPSSTSTLPTHILAVASSRSSASEHIHLFPIHSIVLVSHCSALPSLPAQHHTSTTYPSSIHLPLLPLTLPSPAAFSIIHTFLYTHALDSVLRALLPVPAAFAHQGMSHHTVVAALGSGSTLHQLSVYLCDAEGGSLQAVMRHAGHVKELWQDMVALGLCDPELWDTLDLAWEVVLGALNLAAAGR